MCQISNSNLDFIKLVSLCGSFQVQNGAELNYVTPGLRNGKEVNKGSRFKMNCKCAMISILGGRFEVNSEGLSSLVKLTEVSRVIFHFLSSIFSVTVPNNVRKNPTKGVFQ